MVLKLYVVSDGPPSLSVRQALALLELPCQLVDVDFCAGEHMTDQYELMNPQKEIPVLDDDGFYLSESNAILQYICDKFRPGTPLYPQDPQIRAVVNHRLCFNLSTYYASISAYTLAPIFFDYARTPLGLKKVHLALGVLERLLARAATSHAAADHLTIADFPLVNSTMTLEAIGFDFSEYQKPWVQCLSEPHSPGWEGYSYILETNITYNQDRTSLQVSTWYEDFKKDYPELWKISEDAMKEIQHFAANPPDLSHLNHPIHPIRKIKK